MKKLSKEEVSGILPIKHTRETRLRIMLMQLEVGEGLSLPFTEWKQRSSPAYIVYWLKKKKHMEFEYGKHENGKEWLFRRKK